MATTRKSNKRKNKGKGDEADKKKSKAEEEVVSLYSSNPELIPSAIFISLFP